MLRLYAVLAGSMLTLALCFAGPGGYLPRAGPAPLRFGPRASDLPQPDLPPLLMSTPKPVGTEGAADQLSQSPLPGPAFSLRGEPQQVSSSSVVPAAHLDLGGPFNAPPTGWWQILVTNQHGFLTVPVPRVDFLPPEVPAPQSSAVYQITP
jgi:hypothetical protein